MSDELAAVHERTRARLLAIIMGKLQFGHDTGEFMRLDKAADWTQRPTFSTARVKIDAARSLRRHVDASRARRPRVLTRRPATFTR